MISKELLSEVLGFKVLKIDTDDNVVIAYKTKSLNRFVDGVENNIHELAHKVKEWAKTNGYTTFSCTDAAHIYSDSDGNEEGILFSIEFEPEPEAIFKCGQWILDNKPNNGDS